jgi:antitoxin (DNA-binding transcriptional repressor) of toxin-antitoxin stability system
MKASFVDLRRKSSQVIRALARNESVTVLYRGKPAAVMQPLPSAAGRAAVKTQDHPAFGMWADREDLKDVAAHVRALRRGRRHGL